MLFTVCLFFCSSESFKKLGLPPEKKQNGGKLRAGPPNDAEVAKVNEADKAKATDADKADKANSPNKATDADKADEADLPDKAVDATEANKVEATEADKADAIVLFFIITNIVILIPRSLLDEGIVIILYSLAKYSAVFAKRKGYFGIMISNNQCGIDRRCLCSKFGMIIDATKLAQQ